MGQHTPGAGIFDALVRNRTEGRPAVRPFKKKAQPAEAARQKGNTNLQAYPTGLAMSSQSGPSTEKSTGVSPGLSFQRRPNINLHNQTQQGTLLETASHGFGQWFTVRGVWERLSQRL
jgi:hypothetical protein